MGASICKKCGKKFSESITTNLSDVFDGVCSDCVHRIFGKVATEMQKSGYKPEGVNESTR
jgi:DNA-directed RNA polymerase subunit RPC12/RpoP